MERTIKPMPMADQPTATSDAPPTAAETSADGTRAKIVKRELTRQEEAAVTERTNSMNDVTMITQQQLQVLGLTMDNANSVLLAMLYTQVRHLQAMFDALTDIMLTAPILVAVPNPDPVKAAAGEEMLTGIGPLNVISYMKACTLKLDNQVSMIQRQILSAGGAVPPQGSKGQ